ncbi:MAG: hypothetical protein M3435_06760 [Actinomycetota bacterium]|nr:hypothetical protein [Actinomycetota bacterium]
MRFFDFPKGERHGELNRHEALREASGRIVCYLSDDDLLLPDHAAEMSLLLEVADFAHSISARLGVDGTLENFPWNLSRPEFVEVGLGRKASIGLTGVAHTLAAYRRLPFGWRTTPDGGPTDHHMWRQWLEQPGFRGAMGERLTYLTFPEPWWGKLPPEERRASLEGWFRRSREPGFAEELDSMLEEAIRRAAEDYHLWARSEQLTVQAIRSTRSWRLRERFVSAAPLRALLARRRGAS